MPAKGFKTITVSEEVYLRLKKLSEISGKSLSRTLVDIIRQTEDFWIEWEKRWKPLLIEWEKYLKDMRKPRVGIT